MNIDNKEENFKTETNNLHERYTALDQDFKQLKKLIESISPSLDVIKMKMVPIKEELKLSDNLIKTIKKTSSDISIGIGKMIGNIMAGKEPNFVNSVPYRTRSIINELGEIFSNFSGARSMGGPVQAGMSYLVGERGPELFVPNSGGSVVSNNRLSMPNITINVTAQDADSFRKSKIQLIKELSSAILQNLRK